MSGCVRVPPASSGHPRPAHAATSAGGTPPFSHADTAACLGDSLLSSVLRRQLLIGRDELVPPRLDVAALTPGDVGGEAFGVDLPPGPVEGDLVQGQTGDLDDQDGLVAVGGQ